MTFWRRCALRECGVEFAVVGGLAAVLNGAPVTTFDLDIVPARVLNLATIVALKEELAGEKDLAVLPILRTLEQKQKESG